MVVVESGEWGVGWSGGVSSTLWSRRQGISPSALLKMRWVVSLKDDGQLKAR